MTRSARRRARVMVAGIVLWTGGWSAASAAPGLVINGGAPATNDPNVTLDLTPPPEAAQVQVGLDAAFGSSVTVPVAARVAATIPLDGQTERRVELWVRYLDGAGQPLPAPQVSESILFDNSPPRIAVTAISQLAPVFVCRRGGRAVAGTDPRRLSLGMRVAVGENGVGGTEIELAGVRPEVAGWQPPALPVRFTAAAKGRFTLRARDALGNVSPPLDAVVPRARYTELRPGALAFARAFDCPRSTPSAWNARIRRAWAASGRRAGHRQILSVAPSRLAWTYYGGQGIALNWVHAATVLKVHLKHGRLGAYRAAIAETLALSTTGTSSGTTYRVNENWFTTPDDGRRPPWRDAMGTAVILASLVPAVPSDAPEHERELALRAATEYLAAFGVDWREGGLRWTGRGPGEWFLEYTYRTDDRVLNGFMQAVVSLDRFARQADRLGARDPRWRVLAARARRHVRQAARSLRYWLPFYDLGGGATRYSLFSGAASAHYRLYHQQLLGQLAAIPYLSQATRATFMRYRVRWGGSQQPLAWSDDPLVAFVLGRPAAHDAAGRAEDRDQVERPIDPTTARP